MISANITFVGQKTKKDFEYIPIISNQYAAERTERFCREHYGYSWLVRNKPVNNTLHALWLATQTLEYPMLLYTKPANSANIC